MSKSKNTIFKTLILAAFLLIGLYFIPLQEVYAAAGPARVYAVEYYDENIIVSNNGNSKIYFATDTEAAVNKWDVITVDPTSSYTAIDISWLSTTEENAILIKGDVDPTPSRVIVKEKPAKLTVAINYSSLDSLSSSSVIGSIVNIMSTVGTGDKPITFDDLEWKKGENGQWTSTRKLTKGLIENYFVKGVYLNFRIRAVDDTVTVSLSGTPKDLNENRIQGIAGGIRYYENIPAATYGSNYPDGTKGRRCSDPIKVKIVKKSETPVTGIDGEEFKAAIKYGKEYKVTVTYPDNTNGYSNWAQITDKTIKNVSLAALANNVTPKNSGGIVYDGLTVGLPAMLIEVREFATSRAASTQITQINLDAQRNLTKAIQKGTPVSTVVQTKDDIYVSYVGNKSLLLTIPFASADLPYEYCVVKPGAIFDINQVSWSSVTKNTGIKIPASKAIDGGTLYVRQREINYKAATKTASAISYELASTYVNYAINYPSVPVATKANLTYTKGYTPTPLTITVTLNASGKLPYETVVKYIKLGTKTVGFTSNTVTTGGVSTMTITLISADLEALYNCTNKALTIGYTNGTTDKISIKLSIKSPTPSGILSLTTEKGATAGNTKISVVSSIGLGNTWVYVISDAAVTGKNIEDTLPSGTGTVFTSGTEITVAANKYVTVYELNSTRNIIKYKSIQITN